MYEIRNWTFNELDKKISEEIQKYLPGKMFDIHAHIYCLDKLGEQDNLYIEGPKEATIEVWRKKMGEIVGESRLAGGLFIPPPPSSVDYIDAANSFVIGELKKYPDKKGLILIPPDWKREKLEEHLLNRQIVGIKPFSTFSDYEPHWESPLRTFLPEWAWAAANDHGLIILVHLVRYKALADPENYKEIVNMCKKYPHARLLLDHTARGFHAPNTVEGVMHLRGLENVWFDFSCICEPAAIIAILEHFGPKKLMWGSDFPLSRLRGKSVTSGDGFFWLSPNNVDWTSYNKMCDPTLLGIESLRAAKEAFEQFGINNKDKDDIFCGNAARLLGY